MGRKSTAKRKHKARERNARSAAMRSRAVPSATAGAQDVKSVAEYMEAAHACIEAQDFEQAVNFAMSALSVEPDHIDALDLLGELLFEMGDATNAAAVYRRAIAVDPTGSFHRYMVLGQFADDLGDAEALFRQGVDLVRAQHAAAPSAESAGTLSNALCSLAEVFLQQSALDENADVQCEALLEEAMAADAANMQPVQALASLRLCQERREDAAQLMARVVAHVDAAVAAADMVVNAEATLPPYEFRTETAKLLMELADFATAQRVLVHLHSEHDQSPEVMYLLGLAHYRQGAMEDAVAFAEGALGLLERLGIEDGELRGELLDLQGAAQSGKGMEE